MTPRQFKELQDMASGYKIRKKRPSIKIPANRLESTANKREHWAEKARRTTEQRQLGYLMGLEQWNKYRLANPHWKYPLKITLLRIGKRDLDADNLAHCFKGIQDGVADALSINDGDRTKVEWTYKQERGLDYDCKVSIL
jgi:hypothetical protein